MPALREESMSVFLNSVTALFFPSCHLHLSSQFEVIPKLLEIKIENITIWQLKFYQMQVILINSIFMVILCVIFCLVTMTRSFNYNSNILNTFWFNYLGFLTFFLGFVRWAIDYLFWPWCTSSKYFYFQHLIVTGTYKGKERFNTGKGWQTAVRLKPSYDPPPALYWSLLQKSGPGTLCLPPGQGARPRHQRHGGAGDDGRGVLHLL